jgi:7,8-dihydropterin-6-yl-methyl-4-(beta-D-ribofuranosyl)aminobenzene 5'-phosphate synthase
MKGFKSLFFCVFLIAFVLFASHLEAIGQEEVKEDSTGAEVTMITLYDNYKHNPELKTGWGFSCLVKVKDKDILFDTGADNPTLLSNMKKLKIDPREIDLVVLSHIHGDHTGGLSGILEANSDISVYLPKSFPQDFKDGVKSYKAKVVEVDDSATIYENVITTGELGTYIKEQSLIVKTSKGLVVITGCAHPGIVEILKEAQKITGEDIYLVLGGFHLAGAGDSELKKIVKSFRELGVKKAAPCHCSGDRTRELFKEEYIEDFISNGVGKIIEI